MATILIVDDDPAIVEFLADLVIDANHTPVRAANGREALTLAQQHQPSLIISDVMMPIMDGYTLLHELRATPNFQHTLVILVSANASSTEMYQSTATAFSQKPLDLDLIESFLARLS